MDNKELSAEFLEIIVEPMVSAEAKALNSLFTTVLSSLPYYNDAAKRAELAKFSVASLQILTTANPAAVLVAKLNSVISGFCFSEPDDDLIWINWFGVHPIQRRKGVASALLKALFQSAREKQIHKIWCDCRTENNESICVLTRHQYRQICTVKNHWYGQDFILWEKLVQ